MNKIFLGYKCLLNVYFEIIQTQNRRPNNIQKTSLKSYKMQIKVFAYLGLPSNRTLNNPALELCFYIGLAKLYIIINNMTPDATTPDKNSWEG